ncbi:MAG: hypothetical protein WBC29_01825 [Candidatus Moraniibacteriota bacterium]
MPKKPVTTIEDKYQPNVWGSDGSGGFIDLQVPSGQRCLVRRPGVEGLMRAGVLHDLDSLSAIVDQKHIKRVEGRPQVNPESLLKDQRSLDNVLHVADRVVAYVVVRPEVHIAPNDDTLRVAGHVYTDMIDLEDKMFILNFAVGGSSDIAGFRRESNKALGSLADREINAPTTKRHPRNKR